jgi:hypothetical protein
MEDRMSLLRIVMIAGLSLCATAAAASPASDSLLNADRALAAKAQLVAGLKSPDYVSKTATFAPFFIQIFGATAIVQGANDSTGALKGAPFSGS